MKSASFSCPMKACLHDSALGESSSFSVGGEARCNTSRRGVDMLGAEEARREAVIVWLSYIRPIGQCL